MWSLTTSSGLSGSLSTAYYSIDDDGDSTAGFARAGSEDAVTQPDPERLQSPEIDAAQVTEVEGSTDIVDPVVEQPDPVVEQPDPVVVQPVDAVVVEPAAADALLNDTQQKVMRCVRELDFMGRLGGDMALADYRAVARVLYPEVEVPAPGDVARLQELQFIQTGDGTWSILEAGKAYILQQVARWNAEEAAEAEAHDKWLWQQTLRAIWWVGRFKAEEERWTPTRKEVLRVIDRWGLEKKHYKRKNAKSMGPNNLRRKKLITLSGTGQWTLTEAGKQLLLSTYEAAQAP